ALERNDQQLPETSDRAYAKRIRRLIVAGIVTLLAATAGWLASQRIVSSSPRMTSLAVLPFANHTGDPSQQYFVDAMHDAVIAELSQIRALTIMSRQSVLRYRGTDRTTPEIAQDLKVDDVVEGSVFRVGDSVRITVQVLQARPSERHLWAGNFLTDLRGVLSLHGRVAQAIAQ